jgi:hypothetical protein
LHYTKVYGMRTESKGMMTLIDFIHKVGAPYHHHNDNSKMQTSEAWKEILRKYCISDGMMEPHHPWQNYAEHQMSGTKPMTKQLLDRTAAPDDLWFLAMEYIVYLYSRTSEPTHKWKTPSEVTFGETPNILELLQFTFYQKIYYHDPEAPFPNSGEKLGHFVGIASNVGDALTYYILTNDTNQVISQSVLCPANLGGIPKNC